MRDISHQAITKQVAVSSNVLDGLDPPAKRKDVAITFFLERHRNRHPELSVPHLESVIRAINNVITQFLMSVKTLISSDRVLNSQDVGCIWDLIHIILSRQTVATNKEGPRWKRLSFDIMEQLQQFRVDFISKEIHSEHAHLRTDKLVPHSIHNIDPSGNSKDSNPSEIVIACAHGLIRVFPVLNQEELFSQFNVPTGRKLWDKLLHQTLPPDVHLDVEGLNTPSQETVGASGNNGVP
ncbi:hypothetical protein BDQ17DRAFT_1347173 [Cyathus striatus]|nr:hypothetical protein BDQ17DRAFT_1347173 [Cyathus striatus]